jgi:tRNA(Ile)-lysidine synthetase-like protein
LALLKLGVYDDPDSRWSLSVAKADRISKPARSSVETSVAEEAFRRGLHCRPLRPGDKIRPFGFKGSRKLADVLSEAKLTKIARSRLPIVCDEDGPLWAPGICLDERARGINPEDDLILLRFGPWGRTEVAETYGPPEA